MQSRFPSPLGRSQGLTLSNVGSGALFPRTKFWQQHQGGRGMSQDAVDILFEGSKYFGNTKTLFHIALVEHISHDVIEVVSYDKRHSVEAPSLFLSYSTLLLRLNGNAVTQRILDLREEAEERDLVADQHKIIKIALGEVMFDFIANRLFASVVGVNRAKLEFKLLPKDVITMSVPDPLCTKPEKLKPFSYASVMTSEGKGLSSKEKWCTPIILAKVAKSRSLHQRDGKSWGEFGLLFADGDTDTISTAMFSTVTRANSDAGSQTGFSVSSQSQRWTLAQRPFLAAAAGDTAPAEQDSAPPQPSKAQRQGSISAGYDAIISSLQRGLSIVHGTSIKASAVDVGARDNDAYDSFRPGSAKYFPAASIGSGGSVASFESEGSRKVLSRQGSYGGHGGSMLSRSYSRHMMELAREAGPPAEDDDQPEVDPLAGLSACERANHELRAARYLAALAARNNSVTRPDLHVDTAAGAGAGTGAGASQSDVPSSPSIRLRQAAEALRSGMGGLLHPVIRLFGAVTHKSSSNAVAAED